MSDTVTIPLNKLLAWEGNVRQTEPDKSINELAGSIAAHGLLQSLVVRKDRRGKFAVIAGRRRLLALKSLADAGTIEEGRDIPCTLINDDADATEISLAENVQREAMHPADEFEAFKALIDSGMPVADVAARFGISETVVQKRLKLARVSPVLLSSYRQGEMTLQHIMALTVTDDHALQERVWNELPAWRRNDPDAIREMLTEGEVTAADRRVQCVGLKAYEKAGGALRRDLFSDSDDGIFIEDVPLLESLVAKKLEKVANKVRKEGWKWVEVRPGFNHEEWSDFERRHAEAVPLSPDEEAELMELNAEYEALSEIEEPDTEQQERLDAVFERIDGFEDRPTVWSPETLAIAGAVVTLGHDGEISIRTGLVKPEDVPEGAAKPKRTKDSRGAGAKLSASLIESLTAERSAALNAALIQRPDIALASIVYVMASRIFYGPAETAFQIAPHVASLHRVEGSPAAKAVEEDRQKWSEIIPPDLGNLFEWCIAQPEERLLNLLAFCMAQTINVVLKSDSFDSSRMQHAALLAEVLALNMGAWFTPNAGNYFGRISKAQIIDALQEIKGGTAPAWTGMKKADLAALAEREAAGTGWLPALLRPPEPQPAISA